LDVDICLFVTEEGALYTFGSDYWGCIGCNNELDEEVTTPYRVEFFAENPVSQVACGECHIVVLTGVFTRVYKKSVVARLSFKVSGNLLTL